MKIVEELHGEVTELKKRILGKYIEGKVWKTPSAVKWCKVV
jgi:hypothetical protein